MYFVFLPSILTTTPGAGLTVRRLARDRPFGSPRQSPSPVCHCFCGRGLAAVLVGLVLVGVGTFFAQATTTGFVGRGDRGSRVGQRHLSCELFSRRSRRQRRARAGLRPVRLAFCVAGIALALLLAAVLAVRMRLPAATSSRDERLGCLCTSSFFTGRSRDPPGHQGRPLYRRTSSPPRPCDHPGRPARVTAAAARSDVQGIPKG